MELSHPRRAIGAGAGSEVAGTVGSATGAADFAAIAVNAAGTAGAAAAGAGAGAGATTFAGVHATELASKADFAIDVADTLPDVSTKAGGCCRFNFSSCLKSASAAGTSLPQLLCPCDTVTSLAENQVDSYEYNIGYEIAL
jgi:hypothetical protein